jgi:putative endopeptidase
MSETAPIVSVRGATADGKPPNVVASKLQATSMFRARPKLSRLSAVWALALLALTPLAASFWAEGLSWGLVRAAGAQPVNDRAPSLQESGVDAGIRPGDDFFAYANGDWLKATDIPAGKPRWDARTEIAETTRQRVVKLLADAGAAPVGSSERKVADFHAAYMNEAAIEAKGLSPLKPLFDRIDRVRDKAALARLLGQELRADVDPLNAGVYRSSHVLGLAVGASIHGEKTHAAFLLQGGLGLPDREHYVSTEPRMQALRTQYQATIGHMLTGAGFDRGEQRARAVMALETAIALSHATREASADDHNADNLWTRADFARKAPGMDWQAFFAAAGLARQRDFVAWQPGAVKGVAALLATQPLQAWKDYLRFHAVHSRADVLPRAFAEQALALQLAAAGGASPARALPSARAQRALEATQSAMSNTLGRMYVERYFPAEHKARVQAIAANVIAAFGQRVEAVTWMSPATKTQALAKLKTVFFGIGYPDQWPDDAGLVVDPADALGNLQRIEDRTYRQALARLGQRVDTTVWVIPAQRPGAVLLFHQNAYNFAAALLQPPKFDPAASDAANYGAIGAIVGHELSHFVDSLGSEYEADGRMRRWWTPEDVSRFQASTEALVNQFSGYQPFADLSVNGKLTLTENLADLGGLAAAFDAYRRTLGSKATNKEDVRQQDRQFFIGFARAWRSKSGEQAMRTQIATDGHAPERYRIATVRNIDAWYDAFDVQPGQRLYLEPKARVRIW